MNRIKAVLRSLDHSYYKESIGSCDEIGFYYWVEGRKYNFICMISNSGFFYYDTYTDSIEALDAWNHVEDLYKQFYMDVCNNCQITNPPITIDCNSCEYYQD